jgi:7,8-dihydro-6-hydroxymethylpterin dimethyltransferase
MDPRDRAYIYLEATQAFCPQCLQIVPAKIVEREGAVHLLKHCPLHGSQWELLEEDAAFHHRKRLYDKPATASATDTPMEKGCPYDCGLCPVHEQHGCIGLIEVTGRCDLGCPVCFAAAGRGEHLDLAVITAMMDHFQQAEDQRAEILQISGGEPTTHPNILDIIAAARARNFRYVMLNTNGLRIAAEPEFARALGRFSGGFEVYLQYDGLSVQSHQTLRGRDLTAIKKQAVSNLSAAGVPVTLVCTVAAGVNERELGDLFLWALHTPGIRGLNFQPLAAFGRHDAAVAPAPTISGIIRLLVNQTGGLLQADDFLPLPCNVEGVALTYLMRRQKGFIPLTRQARIADYLPLINNTFFFKMEEMLSAATSEMLHGRHVCDCFKFLADFSKLLPLSFFTRSREERMAYVDRDTFRVSITRFLDTRSFHLRAIQKECVHVITPNGRRIPFSAYNMLHREPAVLPEVPQ